MTPAATLVSEFFVIGSESAYQAFCQPTVSQ